MITSDIIKVFELYVDDTSELSSSEELDLANRVYRKICDSKPWEFLKKEATGSVSGLQITLPTDFEYLVENYNYTDSQYSTQINSKPLVVFIDNNPYQVINWSDRRQYKDNSGVCYVDIVNGKLVFPITKSGTYSFDYKSSPATLTSDTSPVFPARYHEMIAYGMAVDDMTIQLFPKAQSYSIENQIKYNSLLADMALWNANLQNF